MLSVLRHSLTPRIAATVALEVLALNALSFLPALDAAPQHPESLGATPSLLALGYAFFNTAVIQFSFWSFGLYRHETIYCGEKLLRRLALGVAFATCLLAPVYLLFHLVEESHLEALVERTLGAHIAFVGLVLFERIAVLKAFAERPYLGNVLVVGTGPATTELLREATGTAHARFLRIAGILTSDTREVGTRIHGCEVVDGIERIRDHVEYLRARAIVISMPRHARELPANYLIKCKLAGISVFYVGEFYESISKKVLLEDFSPLDFLYRRNLVMTRCRWLSKSVFEKSVALAIAVPAIPVVLAAALLIRLSSRGPILYRQVRAGRDGKPFTLYKLRSMVADAEKDGAVWARERDPRVTRWGRIMRAARIDELPQLLNVLRGEMSFVGPRPERPEFVEELRKSIPHYDQRHLVKPGLTGWAQVAFRYGGSIEDTREKLRYDLYYIKHMSLGFDLVIILTTVRAVFYGGGAR